MTNTSHEDYVLANVHPKIAKAERLRQKGELDAAMREVSQYMDDDFKSVPALLTAATIEMDSNRFGLAQVFLRQAIALEPKIAGLWSNLGVCYREGSDLQEGEDVFKKALALNPEDPFTQMNLGQLYNNLSQPHLAIKHLDKSIELDPSLPDAYYNRGIAKLSLGQWREGWQDYEQGFGNKFRVERSFGSVPRWNGDSGKTLIAYGEQGIGDEVAFSSCIPDLAKDNKVIIECNPRLAGLFKRSFGLETHGTRFDAGINWLHEPSGAPRKIDAAVALGSLPQFYRNEDSEFPGKPYLVADPERRVQWRALLDSLGPKKKIGIAWTGGNKNTFKARRSLDMDDLLPILRQDATFVSLQYMDSPEIHALKRDHGITIHHWKRASQSQDIDDVASLIAELDLVITVQTATVHLCGALGKKCWAMLPSKPRWFYGITGSKLPWYESVKLYRQRDKWVHLVSDVAKDLRNLIQPPIKAVH